jgi:hypothetical protein
VSVKELTKKTVSLLHKGQLLNYEKGAEVSKTVDCNQETVELSSGVVQRELKCSALSVIDEAKELGAEITSCFIQPVGTHPIKTTSVFGKLNLKSDGRKYSRVTKETRIISGEVICDGDNKGLGSETRITFYTNEEPNVTYPAVGSHKILYQSRSVVKSSGQVVYKSSDEITEVEAAQIQATYKSPKAPKYPNGKKKVRVAGKKRGKKLVSL